MISICMLTSGWFECKKSGFTDRRVQIPQAKNAMNDLHGPVSDALIILDSFALHIIKILQ